MSLEYITIFQVYKSPSQILESFLLIQQKERGSGFGNYILIVSISKVIKKISMYFTYPAIENLLIECTLSKV